MNQNTFMVLTPDEIPHEDMPEVNWNLPELEAQNAVSLSKFKELELKEANKLEDARFDYQQREAQILNFIDQLENFVINKEEAFETLQKECKDLSDELVKQQFIYEEKIKNTHEMLTLDKITLEKRFQKEREDLKAASEQYLDNVKKSHELQMERLELEKVSTEAKVKKLAEEKSKIHEESTEVVQIVKEELKKQKDETRKVTESLRDAFVEKEELQNKNVKLETYVVNAKEKIIKLEHEIDGKDNIIENIRLTLKKENLHLKENYEKQISDITHGSKTETETLKNFHEQELKYAKSQLEDMQGKLEETQFKMQKIVKTLEEEIRHEQEIRLKLEERLMEHEQVLPEYEKIQLHRDQLQEAHYDAEKALDYIKARAGPVYNKHVESQRD